MIFLNNKILAWWNSKLMMEIFILLDLITVSQLFNIYIWEIPSKNAKKKIMYVFQEFIRLQNSKLIKNILQIYVSFSTLSWVHNFWTYEWRIPSKNAKEVYFPRIFPIMQFLLDKIPKLIKGILQIFLNFSRLLWV